MTIITVCGWVQRKHKIKRKGVLYFIRQLASIYVLKIKITYKRDGRGGKYTDLLFYIDINA